MNWPDAPLDDVPDEHKQGDEDWSALFSPYIPRRLEITHLRTLQYPDRVLCLRFSPDGRYLAAAVLQTVQLYDRNLGTFVILKESHKTDISRIRSLSFSADGRTLVTGSEDSAVRVSGSAPMTR